jgi:diguanylate cyclase (GGDEF)-like protein/PAS domain S-box-containing protein
VVTALSARTPAVSRFSERWARALTESGRVSGTVAEVAAELHPLTLRLAHAVRDAAFDGDVKPEAGRDVAAALMGRYRATPVVGPTVAVICSSLAEDFGRAADGWPDAAGLRDPAIAAAAAVAEGFSQATRDRALAEQEDMQRAAVAAVRAVETESRTTAARFRALLTHTTVGIALLTMEGRVIDGNAAWAAISGYSLEEMRDRLMVDLVTPGGSRRALARFGELLAGTRDHFRLEIEHQNRHGRVLFLDLSVSRVRCDDGQPDFIVGIAIDVTERRRLQDQLWHEARHDPLTGLPNRTLFFERLDEVLKDPGGGSVGVCYIDLDGFKSVNDGLGHEIGDRLLIRVGERLRQAVAGTGSLLARLGGDEFGVITGGSPGDAEQTRLADRVLSALAEPIVIGGRELTVSASVGLVDTGTAGAEADALMRAADISLYMAKARGRGRWERHDPQRNASQVTRHTLATEMSTALARGEFFLDYQPLVSLRDGVVRRVEALVRWQHPRLGLLNPDEFIEMAERNGHIVALGRWVLATACRQAYEWHERFPDQGIGVNVNIAVGQLHDPELVQHVRVILDDTGLPPQLLHLELTESAVLGDANEPLDALTNLAAAGVRVAIDDFGTGYSNLVHLGRLPARELKLAGSFLPSTGGTDRANDKILPAIISLAHSLGLTVTAEGVESRAQADRLRTLNCDTAQGWFFGRPGPPEDIAAMIESGRLENG